MQQLTTPETKGYDPVYPGENWFFYWKTSASLWESKLAAYSNTETLFIPIYWGFHSEQPGQYDFGDVKPETDLKRLYEIGIRLRKKFVFVIPLTPTPFLANGGLPSYLSRTMALNENGVAQAIVDPQGKINKMFSFFDPRIFQAYRKFSWVIAQYFSKQKINVEVFGADLGYIKKRKFNSYIEDYSHSFEEGFKRYLEEIGKNQSKPFDYPLIPEKEKQLKKNYANMIKDIYLQAASETLSAQWGGLVRVAFLGGSPESILSRSSEEWENEQDYFENFFEIVVNDMLPCSVLLKEDIKKRTLKKSLNDLITESFISEKMNTGIYEDDLNSSFLPLTFFEIYQIKNDDFSTEKHISDIGLNNFFNREFRWTYRVLTEISDQYESERQKVHFVFGKSLNTEMFNNILKMFLNGEKIFIDTSGLAKELQQKLNIFISENSIPTESLNFLTSILKAQLGEGLLLAFDSEKLIEVPMLKRINFWENMIEYLNLKHLKVQNDEDLYFLWKSRASNPYELSYEEIRRVSFYNPSSYKKKAQIYSSKNFAFLKTIDEIHAKVKSSPIGIDIEISPGGSVSLDFGYYE